MEQAKTWLMEKAEQQINLSDKLRNASRLSKASRRGYVFETSKVKKRRDASASPVWLLVLLCQHNELFVTILNIVVVVLTTFESLNLNGTVFISDRNNIIQQYIFVLSVSPPLVLLLLEKGWITSCILSNRFEFNSYTMIVACLHSILISVELIDNINEVMKVTLSTVYINNVNLLLNTIMSIQN